MWFSYFLTILISFYICWDTHSPWNKPVTYPLLTRSICRTKWIICIGETPYTLCTHIIRHGLDLAKFIAELALYVPKKVRVVLLSKFGKSKLPSPKTWGWVGVYCGSNDALHPFWGLFLGLQPSCSAARPRPQEKCIQRRILILFMFFTNILFSVGGSVPCV